VVQVTQTTARSTIERQNISDGVQSMKSWWKFSDRAELVPLTDRTMWRRSQGRSRSQCAVHADVATSAFNEETDFDNTPVREHMFVYWNRSFGG